MKRVEIEDFVRHIEDLPMLPWVAMEAIRWATENSPSMEDIIRISRADPALAIRVLKVANSPFYGAPKGVSTLRDAAARLSLEDLKSIALSTSVIQDGASGHGRYDWEAFRVHSLRCALVSERLAFKVHQQIAEEAFMAGLIHDVGKMLLCEYSEEDVVSSIHLSQEEHLSTVEAELRVFDVEHATVGKWIVEQCGLPDKLRDAVWMHHQPPVDRMEEKEGYTLAALVYLADALAYEGRPVLEGVDRQVVQALHLTEVDLKETLTGLTEKVAALSRETEEDRSKTEQQHVSSLKKANRALGCMSLMLSQGSAQRKVERDRNAVLMRLASAFLSCEDLRQALDLLAHAIVEGLGFEEVACSFQSDDGRGLRKAVRKPPDGRRAVSTAAEEKGISAQTDSNIVEMVASGRVVGYIRVRGHQTTQPGALESLVVFANMGAQALEAIHARQEMRREGELLALEALKAKRAQEKLEVVQEQRMESETLRTLTQIASGIAHDFNNTLGVILPTAQLIKARLDPKDPLRTLVESIEREAERAAELAKRLLFISKREQYKVVVLQPNDTVKEILYSGPKEKRPKESAEENGKTG